MPALKKVYDMGYFWNMFLPLLLFFFTGSMLFFIMNTPDELLPASTQGFAGTSTNIISALAKKATNQ